MNIDKIDRVIAHIEAGNERPVTDWLHYDRCFVGIISRALDVEYAHNVHGEHWVKAQLDISQDNAKRLFLLTNLPNGDMNDGLWEKLFNQRPSEQQRTLVGVLTSMRDTGVAHWNL